MEQKPPSKTWIVGCLGAAGVIIAAIIGLGAPFAERMADIYFPTLTPAGNVIAPTQVIVESNSTQPVNLPTSESNQQPEVTTPAREVPTEEVIIEEPIREHYQVNVGDGIFESGTFSDGLAPYDEDWLWANDHFDIQRIRQEEYPSGCDVSRYNTNLVWISGSAGMQFTVNDEVVGTYQIADNAHGYMFQWPIHMGDKLCAVNFRSIGFSIILGPDVYYHYDSYCYRGHC